MAESVSTGGVKSFTYPKGYGPKLTLEQKREIRDAYLQYEERRERQRKEKRVRMIIIGIIVLLIILVILFFWRS